MSDLPRTRAAREEDLPSLRGIELRAGRSFAGLGMDLVAADEGLPVEQLHAYVGGSRAWVGVDGSDRPVAYVLAERVDGGGHVEQVSVDPAWAGRRIGAALIDRVGEWAAGLGLPHLTLTTFRDVPWNGPYYRRLGFFELADAELGDGLRAIRAAEAAMGLDAWPRIVMCRAVCA